MISRREFLAWSQKVGFSALLLSTACKERKHSIKGGIVGADASRGHRLRAADFGPVIETTQTDVLIIGGGVAGLSAARYLKKHTPDFQLLEMDAVVGGNARGDSNATSKFPWGAHYLPIPSSNDAELIAFLQECNVITHFSRGLPVYNEYYLCHDPKERLFINNIWQEGLIPHEGVPRKDREEIQRFLAMMHDFKSKSGNDQRRAFSIPLENCSHDNNYRRLDLTTADEFLSTNNFQSPYLRWYINYCCADDFGSSIRQTSAWAMIHYFASRSADAGNAPSDAVLTWPEGNFWLTEQMRKAVENNIITDALVYRVQPGRDGVTCSYFDVAQNVSRQIQAKAVILATPQFINQRILTGVDRSIDYTQFTYAPWMVANVVLQGALNEKRGEPLCWDNVIYGSESLGYVHASHQEINLHRDKRVITYYAPLLADDVVSSRKYAYNSSYEDWQRSIFNDLQKPHPAFYEQVEEMNVWLWGHGMIRPTRNFLWSDALQSARQSIDNKIFFAHSDLSGISIFEEAFYQGYRAAQTILSQ